MRTLTARAINEVWRAVPVTAAITFHGGMRVRGQHAERSAALCARSSRAARRSPRVLTRMRSLPAALAPQALTWAWGAPNHESSGSETPDDAALRATATAMQQYAGPFGDETLYPIGRTNRA